MTASSVRAVLLVSSGGCSDRFAVLRADVFDNQCGQDVSHARRRLRQGLMQVVSGRMCRHRCCNGPEVWLPECALRLTQSFARFANWLDVLKADSRAISTAATHAPRAADFINGLQPAASAG